MTTLLVLLIILALFAVPMWPYNPNWGPLPSAIIAILIVILLVGGI